MADSSRPKRRRHRSLGIPRGLSLALEPGMAALQWSRGPAPQAWHEEARGKGGAHGQGVV